MLIFGISTSIDACLLLYYLPDFLLTHVDLDANQVTCIDSLWQVASLGLIIALG